MNAVLHDGQYGTGIRVGEYLQNPAFCLRAINENMKHANLEAIIARSPHTTKVPKPRYTHGLSGKSTTRSSLDCPYLGPGRCTRRVGVPGHERHTPRSLRQRELSSWGEAHRLPRQHLACHRDRQGKERKQGRKEGSGKLKNQQWSSFYHVYRSSTLCNCFVCIHKRPRGHYVGSERCTNVRYILTEPPILIFLQVVCNTPPTCSRFLLATNTSRRASSTQKHEAPLVEGTLANGR